MNSTLQWFHSIFRFFLTSMIWRWTDAFRLRIFSILQLQCFAGRRFELEFSGIMVFKVFWGCGRFLFQTFPLLWYYAWREVWIWITVFVCNKVFNLLCFCQCLISLDKLNLGNCGHPLMSLSVQFYFIESVTVAVVSAISIHIYVIDWEHLDLPLELNLFWALHK